MLNVYLICFLDFFITARKRSCEKVLCLHLSVILWGLCREGRSLSRDASVQGSLCPGGSMSKWGLCPGGGGVFVQEGGLCPRGLCPGRPPSTVKSGRFASYWNAFLLINYYLRVVNLLTQFL